MTKYVCENCLHWSFEAGSGDHKFGDCHRYPPVVLPDPGNFDYAVTASPQTGMEQWCGERASRD